MSLPSYSFVQYDNPLTLANLCSVFIVRNIEHFVSEAVISDKTFYFWKDGISFSDGTLEQLFQATINNRGQLDMRWITLFLGSRCRALKLMTTLVSAAASGNKSDGLLSEHKETLLSSVTSAEGSYSLSEELSHHCTSTPSNVNGANSQVFTTVSLSATFHNMTNPKLAPNVFQNVAVTSGDARQTIIDSTGRIKRFVIRHNVSIREPALLAGLLKSSEPFEITLEDCSNLDLNVLELIAAHCLHLITLKLYRCGSLLTQCLRRFIADSHLSSRAIEQFASGLDLSHLRVLVLHDLPAAATSPDACLLLEHLADRLSTHLLQLDLSGADFSCSASFDWLSRLRHMCMLQLANCKLPSDRTFLIAAICALHDLIRLDFFHLGEQQSDNNADYHGPILGDAFKNPVQVLQQLSENLPQLEHLDLSGTNLPGDVNGGLEQSALPGWPSNRRLSFLGLLGCPSDPCRRENLPAHRVTGEANETQLIAALEAYADRRLATRWILRSVYKLLYEMNATLRAPGHVFELLLERMHRYLSDKHVQLYASAILFHLLRLLGIEKISPMRVRTLVQRLVDTLERYEADHSDHTMSLVRNCLTLLGKVRTYEQVRMGTYELLYEQLVKVLLRIAQHASTIPGNIPDPNLIPVPNPNLNVIALDVLRTILLQQASLSESKLLFGELGGVRIALSILKQQLDSPEVDCSDACAHTCWLLLCIVTDETAPNCKRFIELSGLELFVCSLNRWRESKALQRTMLTLLTNVGEIKCLRGYLKSDELIAIFLEMLDTTDIKDNGISYITASVLSHMLADGEGLWHHKSGCEDADEAPLPVPLVYSRATIGERIIAATERWNPDVACNTTISYTSLIPTLSLITAFDSFASQYWAAWALNNLSLVKPERYCPMLFREGALDILDTAIADARSQDRLRHWLVLTADRIRQHIKYESPCVRLGAVCEQMDSDDND